MHLLRGPVINTASPFLAISHKNKRITKEPLEIVSQDNEPKTRDYDLDKTEDTCFLRTSGPGKQ